jgi:homoserine kinase
VSASLLGGFAIALYDSFLGRTVVRAVKPPEDLGFVVIVPDILKKSTEDARRAVPEGLSRHQHVETVGRAALATLALYASDLDLLLECVVYDPYVEMARAEAGVYGRGLNGELLTEEKRKIFQLYHVAETVSGAGPSRLLWYRFSENRGPEGERPIDKAVETVLDNLSSAGYRAHRIYHTGPSIHGCQIY